MTNPNDSKPGVRLYRAGYVEQKGTVTVVMIADEFGQYVTLSDHDRIVSQKDAVIARIEKILWSFYNDDSVVPAWNEAREYFTERIEREGVEK